MLNMFFTVISKFIGSYGTVAMDVSKDWFILYRILFIPLSLFIYCLAFLVVLSVLLIVIFIASPISYLSKAVFN
jgi:hypothetical protein